MSRGDYPKIGGARDMREKWHTVKRIPRPGSRWPRVEITINEKTKNRCVVCGGPATHMTEVEVNWFRGDDESVKTCAEHRQDITGIVQAWEREAEAKRKAP